MGIRLLTLDALGTLFRLREPLAVVYERHLATKFPQIANHGTKIGQPMEAAYRRAIKVALGHQRRLQPCYGVHQLDSCQTDLSCGRSWRRGGQAQSWWMSVIEQVLLAVHPTLSVDAGDERESNALLRSLCGDIYAHYSRGNAYQAYPDAQQLLKQLSIFRQRNELRVAVISNNDRRLSGILEELQMLSLVDFCFDAESMAIEKPHPDAYRKPLLAMRNRDPAYFIDKPLLSNQILHVGDDYEMDYRVTVEQLGWHARLLDRDGQSSATTIPSLLDLLPLFNAE